jgi:hypothetical protein
MCWKPYFIIPGEGDKHCLNGQAFATKAEALASASARLMRWTMPSGYGADESVESVNYRWDAVKGDIHLDEVQS